MKKHIVLATTCCAISVGMAHAQSTVTTSGGTSGYVPAFTGAATLGNSIIQQNSVGIGIGKVPNAVLDVNGTLVVRGPLTMPRVRDATTTAGSNSVPLLLAGQGYSSSSKVNVSTYFQLQANTTGNNTSSPGTTLNLYYNNGSTTADTGFYINPNGTIHFATAQTFPSTANGITAVTHDSSLTGAGTSASPLGIASVGHDANFDGNGTAASPLTLDSVLNVGELKAAQNVTANNNGDYGAALTGSDLTGEGIGVRGSSIASGSNNDGYGGILEGAIGVFAYGTQYAGYFSGEVYVAGNLAKSGGSFKIDDPIDPANKLLSHSFVESPDMKNIYDGTITTDSNGYATVTMPDWFQALNQDFRYQLTPIGQFAQAIVATEIDNNTFTIRTDKPNVKVSWQVTGTRHDEWANAHRIPVEEEKSEAERGKYLHPELFGHVGEPALMPRNPHTNALTRP